MVNFPDELLVEILSRLPVETLVRFKCVCKSWYALIESPKFVSRHLANQSKDDVLLMHNRGGNFMSFLSNVGNYGDDASCIVDFDLEIKCPSHEANCCNHLSLQGYCDGVVLLTDFDEQFMLCNPAIKEIRFLPKSRTFLKLMANLNPLHAGTSTVGFGYDPRTDDYKVIRVRVFWADEDYGFELPNRAEVFSLRENSSWREVDGIIGAKLYHSDDLEQYFDGIHYWIGKDYDTEKKVVVSFDMAGEVFQTAPIPDVCDDEEKVLYLGVLKNETIALFVWPKEEIEKCIDVWVMKKFGVKESWTKELTIGPLFELNRPLVFWKNDEELLHEDKKGRLVSYDLATREAKTYPVHHKLYYFMLWRAYLYVKSLVSVHKREDNMV